MGGSRKTNYTMNFGGTQQGKTYGSYKSPQMSRNGKGVANRNQKYKSSQNSRVKNGRAGRGNSKRRVNPKIQSPFVDEELDQAQIKH